MIYRYSRLILFLVLFHVRRGNALIGEEIPLLVELVSKTTSQLNELERIVSNGEKLTESMVKYNEVLEDQYFKAERLKILAEELTIKRNAQDLEGLNFHLRSLKSAMGSTKNILESYRAAVIVEKRHENRLFYAKEINQKKKNLTEIQIRKSSKRSSNSQANRLTAQNTGLLLESSLNQELELSRISHQLAKANRIKAQSYLQERVRDKSKQDFYSGMYSSHQRGVRDDRKLSSYRK